MKFLPEEQMCQKARHHERYCESNFQTYLNIHCITGKDLEYTMEYSHGIQHRLVEVTSVSMTLKWDAKTG